MQNKFYRETKEKKTVLELDLIDIQNGRAEGLIALTDKEMEDFLNPPKTVEELEEIRINTINQKVNEIIEAKYPFQYAQVNIPAKGIKNDTGEHYDDRDIEEMYMFINTALLIGKQAKANGTKPEDIDWMELDRKMTVFLESRSK